MISEIDGDPVDFAFEVVETIAGLAACAASALGVIAWIAPAALARLFGLA